MDSEKIRLWRADKSMSSIYEISTRALFMNKSKLSISLFVILFTIVFTPYLTQDAFADFTTITSFVANDPDDGDTVYSVGDTFTIGFVPATNQTGIMTDAGVAGNFTFGVNNIQDSTFSGVWTDASTLTLTVNAVGATTPIISTTTISAAAGNTIGRHSSPDPNHNATGTATLSGDFGLVIAVSTSNGGGCSGDCEEPTLGVTNVGTRLVDNGFTYNGQSIDVERYFTPYPLVTVQTGEQNVAEFKIYENTGSDNISHFELAFGLAKGQSIGMSKAVINWDKSWDGIETVTLVDPENVLDKIDVTTSEGNCSDESQTKCLIVKVTHTFRAPLDFNILGTNVWDVKRNGWQNFYNHGIEIVGESLNPPKQYDGIYKGHIYHLTETGKNTAVDEFGNSWSLEYGSWTMDYVPAERIPDTSSIMTRMHSEFPQLKETEIDNAIGQLLILCPTCLTPYADFEDSFSLQYSERIERANNLELQQNMVFESERAQKILEQLLDPSLDHQ